MTKTLIGKTAPDFKLPDHEGRVVSLKDYRGQVVILYFYPRDNTPGCTQEACDFRDAARKLSRRNTIVIGISPDTETSHLKFRDKFSLPFTLLSDTEHRAAKAYAVYKKKNMYGKMVYGIERSTFVIDAKGKVIQEHRKVKVDGHVESLLEQL